ncbi:hypothetical protein ACHAPT_009753 [Fusarium lateritium]
MSEWNKSSSVDKMMIRIGDFYELPVVITSPREGRQIANGYQVGRFDTDLYLGSEDNFIMMRSWVQECQQNHPDCLNREAPKLPTRVIDVGVDDTESVQLLCSQGMRANYIALSHCWGGRIRSVLTEGCLEEFQAGILCSSLPRNFRDAIIITRNLGIRYLWIDSLCIIQDSKSDWEVESKTMGHVYRNAFLTISAMAAAGSEGGILGPSPTIDFPKPAAVRVFSEDHENDALVKLHMAHDERFPSWFQVSSQSPLNSRGWVLQEKILSRRTLYFGSRTIYWKCPKVLQGSDGAPLLMVHPLPTEEYRRLGALIHGKIQGKVLGDDRKELLTDYYSVVEHYSRRKLTVASDKLPAIAGIASNLGPALGGEYLAGLWSDDIHRGLQWSSASVSVLDTFRAPSWSWASVDGPLSFHYYTPDSEYNLDEWKLQLIDHDMSFSNPDNPFGEVTGGRLVVQGWTMPLVWEKDVVVSSLNTSFVQFDARGERKAMILSKDLTCFLYPDIPVQKSAGQPPASEDAFQGQTYVALMVAARRGLRRMRSWNAEDGSCAVVETSGLVLRLDGENYVRVGSYRASLEEDSLEEWPQMWEMQILVLI